MGTVNGVDLFLLGRALMKIGEAAMPEPEGGSGRHGGSTRSVLIVAGDVSAHPASAVGEIAERTGLPQSQVSTAVARLKEAGAVTAAPDPADRRRLLVSPAAEASARVAAVRETSVDSALAAALDGPGEAELAEVAAALDLLARRLTPRTFTG
ncbi:MarR family transcriptional regulator [Streptomyces mangrovisoli]|uniref:MarR family transcriptional regulator n=1 Tax=Streptomyces mangrovisoli TaxID=1428628 RepID=A0A1J4P0D5_9ACTN|nr:helix-turn-helix domain-containing protein [Streptomyces mangrovisoli]OIJ68193.1 MarR family transcriptional regulator [Streptomyces mangrovisoli]